MFFPACHTFHYLNSTLMLFPFLFPAIYYLRLVHVNESWEFQMLPSLHIGV